jgi:hypothetical protein
MDKISNFTNYKLYWLEKSAFKQNFELHSELDSLLASLTFKKLSGTLAEAESAEGSWTFKRVGFLNPKVTIRTQQKEEDIAIFHPKSFSKSILEFSNKKVFYWHHTNFWSTQWAFTDESGKELVSFKPGSKEHKFSDLFKEQAIVEFQSEAKIIQELPLLTIFGWYIIVCHNMDIAVSSSIVASTGI